MSTRPTSVRRCPYELEPEEFRVVQGQLQCPVPTYRYFTHYVQADTMCNKLQHELDLAKQENRRLENRLQMLLDSSHAPSSPRHPISKILLTKGETSMNAFLQAANKFSPGDFIMLSESAAAVRFIATKDSCRYLTVDQNDQGMVLLNLVLGFVDAMSQMNICVTDWMFDAIQGEIKKLGLQKEDEDQVLNLCSRGKQAYKKLIKKGGPSSKSEGQEMLSLMLDCFRDVGSIFASTFLRYRGSSASEPGA